MLGLEAFFLVPFEITCALFFDFFKTPPCTSFARLALGLCRIGKEESRLLSLATSMPATGPLDIMVRSKGLGYFCRACW